MKKVLNALSYVIIAAIIVCVIASLLGVKPRIVLSGSMEPTIHTGSVCFINTNTPYEDISAGDIVAYSSPLGMEVTHRVISIQETGFETKGDANEASDGVSVNNGNYIGKTLWSIPYIGYVIVWVRQPVVLAIIFVVVCAMLIIDNICSKDEKPVKKPGKYLRKKNPKA